MFTIACLATLIQMRYEEYTPVNVATLEYFTGNDFALENNIKDNLGNVRNNVVSPKPVGWLSIPAPVEPPVRSLRATIPATQSHYSGGGNHHSGN